MGLTKTYGAHKDPWDIQRPMGLTITLTMPPIIRWRSKLRPMGHTKTLCGSQRPMGLTVALSDTYDELTVHDVTVPLLEHQVHGDVLQTFLQRVEYQLVPTVQHQLSIKEGRVNGCGFVIGLVDGKRIHSVGMTVACTTSAVNQGRGCGL